MIRSLVQFKEIIYLSKLKTIKVAKKLTISKLYKNYENSKKTYSTKKHRKKCNLNVNI